MRHDADIIIPITAANPHLYTLATVCLRTCRATTECPIYAMVNNTPDKETKELLWDQCKSLGIEYHYVDGTFSLSRTWNLGTDLSALPYGGNPYVIYSGMDVIFYSDWLDNILNSWEQEPDYWIVWPYWFDTRNFGTSCLKEWRPRKGLLSSHNPCGALDVLRRKSGHRWDESFQEWELDADLLLYMQSKQLKGACCLSSRVDHLVESVRDNINFYDHYGMDKMDLRARASKHLKHKWNLP